VRLSDHHKRRSLGDQIETLSGVAYDDDMLDWYARYKRRRQETVRRQGKKLAQAQRAMLPIARSIVPDSVVIQEGPYPLWGYAGGFSFVVAGMTDRQRYALEFAPGMVDAMRAELCKAGFSRGQAEKAKFQFKSDEVDGYYKWLKR
jgi:hypothetical protein